MIKCRTKKLAVEGVRILNDKGIYCEFDGHYNIYAFKSGEDEKKGFEILDYDYQGIIKELRK